ncbi:MAG TPA: acyltransferase [Actinomycetota bacterium]|nr:acyltransferase [Actinomycetota bacterium]
MTELTPGSRAPVDRRLGYQPSLDGMRAVAVLAVLGFHAFEWPSGGFLGVDVFFVLSGFLITTILLEERIATGAVSFKAFYSRRMLRLFPALAVFLAGYVIVLVASGEASNARFLDALSALLYVSNWVIALGGAFHQEGIGHLWSVAVEEQFYLLWPALLVLLASRGLRSALALAAALTAALVVWRIGLTTTGAPFVRLYYALDTRFDELLVGCLGGIAYVHAGDRLRAIDRGLARRASIAALLLLAVAIVLVPQADYDVLHLGGYTVLAAATLVIVVVCVTGLWPGLERALSAPALVFVGKISYSLYLWHVLVILVASRATFLPEVVREVAQVPLSFAAACASYFFVERPFLRLKERFASRRVVMPERGPGRFPFDPEPSA